MAEKKTESSIREYVDALEKRDVEMALSFFADDAVWHAPEGEFKGKEEIKRYITWLTSTARIQVQKFEDTGIGLLVKGNKAVYEYMWEAISSEEHRIRAAGVCLYEFRDDKCVYHRSIYDRILGAQQGATGFIERRVVNSVLYLLESGLQRA